MSQLWGYGHKATSLYSPWKHGSLWNTVPELWSDHNMDNTAIRWHFPSRQYPYVSGHTVCRSNPWKSSASVVTYGRSFHLTCNFLPPSESIITTLYYSCLGAWANCSPGCFGREWSCYRGRWTGRQPRTLRKIWVLHGGRATSQRSYWCPVGASML